MKRRTAQVFIGALSGMLFCECSVDMVECDPLEPRYEEIGLVNVVVVGQDESDNLHVIDDAGSRTEINYRVFRSIEEELVRRKVVGFSGGTTTGEGSHFTFTVLDGEDDYVLSAIVPEFGENEMSICDENLETDCENSGNYTDLSIRSETILEDMEIRNFPGTIMISHFAAAESGEKIVVTRPEEDWDEKDTELYIGNPEKMTQKEIVNYVMLLDGGSIVITYLEGNDEAHLTLPNDISSEDPWEGATLENSGEVISVTRLPVEDYDHSEFKYLCFPQN